MRSQHSHGLWLDVVTSFYPCQITSTYWRTDGEVKQPLGVIRGVQAGSFEALQLENTILRAWIALHLKPGEVVDIDKWVRKKMEES